MASQSPSNSGPVPIKLTLVISSELSLTVDTVARDECHAKAIIAAAHEKAERLKELEWQRSQ
ncbi:hypothetical protein HYPP_02617 [Hyphomicrobium sp. ghe19]|nr:hypothetical protein HYPP_02617 [Hyphomicrobium sp. ghe19]